MTKNLNLHQKTVSDLLTRKDFSGLFQLFTDQSFSFSDLLLFYKRANKPSDKKAVALFSESEFWQSPIPHFHLESILTSDLKISFFQSYFANDSFCNHELNLHLLSISPDDFIRYFKFWKPFLNVNFENSFSVLASRSAQAEKAKKELEIVVDELRRIDLEEGKDNQILLQYNLSEILLAFTLLYWDFKQHPSNHNNKAYQIKIEIALVDEIDRVLKLLRSNNKINDDSFKFSTNDLLQKDFKKYEAPHHILGKEGEDAPLPENLKHIAHLIQKGIGRAEKSGCIDLYLGGFADFDTAFQRPARLTTNRIFEKFQINNAKSQPEEMFLLGFTLASIDKIKKEARTEIKNEQKVLEFYGIPLEIPSNGQMVDLTKVLKLLKYISVYKGPDERTIYSAQDYILMNQGDKRFIEFFGSNESISVFNHEHLVERISSYFKWEKGDTGRTFDFICTDLVNGMLPHSWICSPFLKIGEQVVWMGSFLRDRRWDNILINKLKKERQFASLVNTLSSAFEKQIEGSFKRSGFKVKNGLRFRTSEGQSGEIDVLAFKDNSLFIVEAKSGTRNDDFSHAVFAELTRLEGSAAEQLTKIISYIKEDWNKIKEELQIDDSISLDKVNLMPLIITDYFEGDLQLYKSSFRKLTLLELEVILTNNKKQLLEVYELMQVMNNSGNPNFNSAKQEQTNWDLWNGSSEISAQQLVKCIEQNLIWKDLERTWKFQELKFSIG